MTRIKTTEIPPNSISLFNDGGFVALTDKMGDDTKVINAARVSFKKHIDTFDPDKDGGLLDFLVKNKHLSPFRHCYVTFHLKAPEAIMRQAYKHVVGIEWTAAPTKDHAWNEISGRYVEYEDVYEPEIFRPQSENNKQGSEYGDLGDTYIPYSIYTVREAYKKAIASSTQIYKELIAAGVAKEQARLCMPFSTFTEVYWTASLEAIAHFIKLRQHEGAQWEIRTLAEALEKLVVKEFPHSFKALMDHL